MKKLLYPPLLVLLMLMSAVVHADIGEKQAVSIAQSVFPGRVLAVKQLQENNAPVYRVKTLSAGGAVHESDAGAG